MATYNYDIRFKSLCLVTISVEINRESNSEATKRINQPRIRIMKSTQFQTRHPLHHTNKKQNLITPNQTVSPYHLNKISIFPPLHINSCFLPLRPIPSVSSFYPILPSATIETSLRPRSPLTVPTISHNDEDCASVNSPPVSIWSPNASLASCEDMVDDELYIRRVFSFDEWEYNHPEHQSKSPLHREPISSNDLNRYQDSLKTLMHLPASRTTTSTPSLFQDIWEKRLQDEELGYRTSSFTTLSTFSETPIPSPESAFRRFQKNHHNVSPIIDTTALSSCTAPWCPSIPRECSEGSFVQIDLNNDDSEDGGIVQQPHHSWSIPEYVLVSPQESMEEEEIEL